MAGSGCGRVGAYIRALVCLTQRYKASARPDALLGEGAVSGPEITVDEALWRGSVQKLTGANYSCSLRRTRSSARFEDHMPWVRVYSRWIWCWLMAFLRGKAL